MRVLLKIGGEPAQNQEKDIGYFSFDRKRNNKLLKSTIFLFTAFKEGKSSTRQLYISNSETNSGEIEGKNL